MSLVSEPRSPFSPVSDFRLPAGVNDLISRRLRRIHERLGQLTEQQAPESLPEIAIHYDRGGCPDKAFEYAMLAAERARAAHAHQDGARFLRIAERNTSSPAQLAQVRSRLASVAEVAGQYDEALELCGLALDYYMGQGDRRAALPLHALRERLRALLGQSANLTLGACLTLDDEARTLDIAAERVPLLALIAQTYVRLGDMQGAERTARECVQAAERAGDPVLLAQALNRLGTAVQGDRPDEALRCFTRAIELSDPAGDRLGLARCHNNAGIIHTRLGEWERARNSFSAAISHAHAGNAPDIWGLAALNLGVVHLKCGEYEAARDLLGEALALFASVRHMERQLYALYNLAHLDRARGEHASASELYDVSAAIAQRIGQSDVEIGARAGAGLSLLELGKVEAGYAALRGAEERMRPRTDWFQGRELLEALRVLTHVADGRLAEAKAQLDQSLAEAEAGDRYGAAWLVAECADALARQEPKYARALLAKYREQVEAFGCPALIRQHAELRERGA